MAASLKTKIFYFLQSPLSSDTVCRHILLIYNSGTFPCKLTCKSNAGTLQRSMRHSLYAYNFNLHFFRGKMLNCGNPSFGGAMYSCPHYGKLKFVPFRCHSRFCPTYGNLYTMQRTPLCPLNWSMLPTATVFLPLMKTSGISFWKTDPCLIVSSIP